MKFLLLLTLLFQQPAWAWGEKKVPVKKGTTPMEYPKSKMTKETCGKVNLAPKMTKVRNQTGLSCYAYTAMELLSFGMKGDYSAMHLAQTYEGQSGEITKSGNLTDMRGFTNGLLEDAVKQGIKQGLCPEGFVPSIDLNQKNPDNYKKIMAHYHKLDSDVEAHKKGCYQDLTFKSVISSGSVDLMDRIAKYREAKKSLVDFTPVKDAVKAAFPTLKLELLNKIYEETDNATDFIKKVAEETCKGWLVKTPKVKGQKTTIVFEGNDAVEEKRTKMLDQINETLNSGRPVGISYITNGLIQESDMNADHGKHVSPVVGRVWDDGACYYVVKNSWGKDWQPSGKAYAMDGMPGYFTMSEQAMMEHTFGATSMIYED